MTQRAKLEPQGYFRRIPLAPHQLVEPVTPTRDAIVLCHLGVAQISPADWTLAIDGLVTRSGRITFDDLLRYPKFEILSVHECAGSPLTPTEPTRRVCNLRWGGVRLADILNECGPTADATFLWSYGADYGDFGGLTIDSYLKDMPLSRLADDVLIAYEMNGAPLPPENGFPARLVVPGFYGTNSVKWLTRLTLADRRADSPFTSRWYNDPIADAAQTTGLSRPVWSIAPESVIVAPAPDSTLDMDREHPIWGWAWSDSGIAHVDISTDGGNAWLPAVTEPRIGRGWQRFSLSWRPAQQGPIRLQSRAHNADGIGQPSAGARNAIRSVAVTVV